MQGCLVLAFTGLLGVHDFLPTALVYCVMMIGTNVLCVVLVLSYIMMIHIHVCADGTTSIPCTVCRASFFFDSIEVSVQTDERENLSIKFKLT